MAGITGAPQNRENRSKLGWGGRLNGVIGVPKLHPLAGRLHHLEFALPSGSGINEFGFVIMT
jgi:hypothetical protein